jgi:hypothetical protein
LRKFNRDECRGHIDYREGRERREEEYLPQRRKDAKGGQFSLAVLDPSQNFVIFALFLVNPIPEELNGKARY